MDYAAFETLDEVSKDNVSNDKFFNAKYSRNTELNKNRLVNYKKIVAFQKYTSSLSDDSLKALFTIMNCYLTNELFNKKGSTDLIKASVFFTYDKFKTASWWSELYTTFLENDVLCDMFAFIDSV